MDSNNELEGPETHLEPVKRIIKISSPPYKAFKSHVHTVNVRKTKNRGGKSSQKVNASDRSENTGVAVLMEIISTIQPLNVEHFCCWFLSAACVRLIIY